MKAPIWNIAAAVAVASMTLAGPAFGRSSQRTGLNFGASARGLDTSDNSTPNDGSVSSSKTESSGSLVSPYIGYAFTSFNLGLMYSSESATTHTTDVSTDGRTTTDRKVQTAGRSVSFFVRYLFATYFFFEGAGGIYEESQNVTTQTTTAQGNGAFNGTAGDYRLSGIGPGYHGAAGLELPINNSGFFFTTAYQVRIVQIRDHVDASSLGQKRSVTQKREALFGIAYYDKP